MIKISVVIPVYNEEKYVADCLNSLLDQSRKDFEIIVVDDGSTDGTKAIISSFPKVQLIEGKHEGAGPARNLGVKVAKGEILVFVDADMTFTPTFIAELVSPIEKGKVKGTFSKNEIVANWDNVWSRCWNINEDWVDQKRHPVDYPNRQKVFRAIKKNEFKRVNGFDSRGYTDDWTLSEKLGYEAVAVDKAEFFHRNPEDLSEIIKQAMWVGKRKYKKGILGTTFALLRSSLPVSLIYGIYKSVNKQTPQFVVFKVVYDLAISVGILEYLLFGSSKK